MQEDLDSSLSCVAVAFDPGAPNGWGYVNRLEVINSETVLDVVCWNDCADCQGASSVEDGLLNRLMLYPNPSSGAVKIKSKDDIIRCDVYNVLGELVSTEKITTSKKEHEINIVKNGLYFINIHTETGVLTNKLTIQK